MAEPIISWEDILEVGQGGPGCGLLHIDGRQPRGAFRYLPPAIAHDGKVYASTFVPGGFVLCAIDPVRLTRQEISARLPYARLVSVEEDEIVYVDRHDGESTSRIKRVEPQPLLARIKGRFAGK